jgi:hypothetical protein
VSMRWVVTWLRSKPAESIAFAVVCAVALFVACAGALFTAPPGSTIKLFPAEADRIVVAANGGSTEVLAFVTEPAGTTVANGVEVLFFSSIGTIDPKVRTRDGIARARFVSDSRSGLARITAISGGPAPAAPAPGPSGSPGGGTTGGATGSGSDTTTIIVGNVAVARMNLAVTPSALVNNRSSLITATVVDENGNPVPNVPVFFAITAITGGTGEPINTEFLESGGAPRFTDNNGQAFDVLASNVARGARLHRTVTITASAAARGDFFKQTVMVPVE